MTSVATKRVVTRLITTPISSFRVMRRRRSVFDQRAASPPDVAQAPRAPPPPPMPAGNPVVFAETLPWLLISIVSYAAFLYLPGRVSSPRARLTRIGGNEFINVASHLHFCIWAWPLQDMLFRLFAVLLFPPRRAAVYFTSMFVVATTTGEGADAAAAPTDGSLSWLAAVLRPLRALLVRPAPDRVDFVPADYRAADYRSHGGVDGGSTYWGYREVCVLTFAATFAIWLVATYAYHTRHAIADARAAREQRADAAAARRVSAKAKRERREEQRRRLAQKLREGGVGADAALHEATLEAETANLAEDEFSDEDVDYDPYGRPVPDPPLVPTVSWMVMGSLVFSSAFLWRQAMPLLISHLFPVAVCLVLGFCVVMPQ
jgi:hypothetical protein